ncbi:thiamine pyrophosphate-binding protein [Rhodobacterales bacterium LSUCC0031]|nr:thiamine pyrophosphate-binding protein [Rhodobacterales bacterium LSUCC0031]
MGLHAFDMLAAVVAQENPGTCFALLGDANMNFATRLAEAGCPMIYVRHEHCAVAAAMAHARKTGGVGFATVTCGPGLTQLTTALPAAVRARIPLVVLAGEAPLKSAWYNQMIDQAPFVTATGAAYRALHHPARLAEGLRDAFLEARMTQGPVVVGIPFDLQNAVWAEQGDLPVPSAAIMPKTSPMPPNPDDVARAVTLVAGAKRVVVMAGLGVAEAGAGAACIALADHLGGLLATTLPARGLFAGHPFNLNVAGGFATETARDCFADADLVIAVGTSLSHHNADGGKLWPKAHLLQIDTAPVTVAQGRIAAHDHLRADARLGVEALLSVLAPQDPGWRSTALADRIANSPADSTQFAPIPGLHDPRDVVLELETHLPQGWEMVNSSGHCSYFVAQMPSRRQENFLTIREFGAIGNGLSFAMGVAAARPETPVVLFDGDGSLLMHMQELETIARHGLKILIVAMNDGAYGSEIHKLRAEGLSDAGAVFGHTDLAAIARGFGIKGVRVDDLAALPGLIAAFAADGGAMLLDIPISDQVASPVIRRAHPPKA